MDRQPRRQRPHVERKKQSTLLLLCRRTAALPLGRGMLTLRIDGNERLMHEVLPMPTINLSGRGPPSTATIQLDATSNNLPTNFMEWMRFHNGVAAGLQVSPRVDIDDNTDQSAVDDLTRIWISYNR